MRDALPLARGQRHAALADDRLELLWQPSMKASSAARRAASRTSASDARGARSGCSPRSSRAAGTAPARRAPPSAAGRRTASRAGRGHRVRTRPCLDRAAAAADPQWSICRSRSGRRSPALAAAHENDTRSRTGAPRLPPSPRCDFGGTGTLGRRPSGRTRRSPGRTRGRRRPRDATAPSRSCTSIGSSRISDTRRSDTRTVARFAYMPHQRLQRRQHPHLVAP